VSISSQDLLAQSWVRDAEMSGWNVGKMRVVGFNKSSLTFGENLSHPSLMWEGKPSEKVAASGRSALHSHRCKMAVSS
jgi:hypothetical protein